MLKNTLVNKKAVQKIAKALGALNKEVVYVGGAVVSLYIDDSSADDVRPTKDIDISLEIASLTELENLRQLLCKKGFNQSPEDDVICRFRFQDIRVDVMGTKEIGWAPANPWFEPGFKERINIDLDDLSIYILPLPYYLATKFVAFYDRGSEDPRTSHDFEDITYIFNYTSNIDEKIINSEKEVKDYLIKCFKDILADDKKQEAILGNLFYEQQSKRFDKIISSLKSIVDEK